MGVQAVQEGRSLFIETDGPRPTTIALNQDEALVVFDAIGAWLGLDTGKRASCLNTLRALDESEVPA